MCLELFQASIEVIVQKSEKNWSPKPRFFRGCSFSFDLVKCGNIDKNNIKEKEPHIEHEKIPWINKQMWNS